MDQISTRWTRYQRSNARQETSARVPPAASCPSCQAEMPQDVDIEAFRAHIQEDAPNHPNLAHDADIDVAFQNMTVQGVSSQNRDSAESHDAHERRSSRKRPVSGAMDSSETPGRNSATPDIATNVADGSSRGSKKVCSPPTSVVLRRGSTPPTPTRSRARPSEIMSDFDRGHASKNSAGRQLWSPGDEQLPKTPQARLSQAALTSHPRRSPQSRPPRQGPQHSDAPPLLTDDTTSTSLMLLQPETRPISQQQLVSEVKGIYAGLVMVESKCIEVDNSQTANTDSDNQLSNDQWRALIALHRTLLHEHHDFFLASQHPSASDALRRLASKYAMPARMWRHGIHSFLELLRHKLPASLEHMLTFIYLAYSMMALLHETVPAFANTWIECLGDLGRYRMAIEDYDIRDREVWTGVSRYWYSKASDKSPTTGRLYHHLAILARPNALQQLYYYAKSLCVPVPFASARDSIMTLFDPLLTSNLPQRPNTVDAAFVRVHGISFSGKGLEQLDESMEEFFELLDGHIGRTTKGWIESGYFMGISLSCSLLGYGIESNALMRAISKQSDDADMAMDDGSLTAVDPDVALKQTLSFAVRTYEIIIRRWGDMNTLAFIHTTLVFLDHLSRFPAAMNHIEDEFPWKLTALMLNYLKQSCKFDPRIDTEDFPGPQEYQWPRPLPEDFAMNGLIYTTDYFPKDWFHTAAVDEDERYFELGSMTNDRRERILWLGRRIARADKWLTWNRAEGQFGVAHKYDIKLDGIPDTSESMEVTPSP